MWGDSATGLGDYCNVNGHSVSIGKVKVLAREQEWMRHKVKEAIHIKQGAFYMNIDQGYQLPPIYGQIKIRMWITVRIIWICIQLLRSGQ